MERIYFFTSIILVLFSSFNLNIAEKIIENREHKNINFPFIKLCNIKLNFQNNICEADEMKAYYYGEKKIIIFTNLKINAELKGRKTLNFIESFEITSEDDLFYSTGKNITINVFDQIVFAKSLHSKLNDEIFFLQDSETLIENIIFKTNHEIKIDLKKNEAIAQEIKIYDKNKIWNGLIENAFLKNETLELNKTNLFSDKIKIFIQKIQITLFLNEILLEKIKIDFKNSTITANHAKVINHSVINIPCIINIEHNNETNNKQKHKIQAENGFLKNNFLFLNNIKIYDLNNKIISFVKTATIDLQDEILILQNGEIAI